MKYEATLCALLTGCTLVPEVKEVVIPTVDICPQTSEEAQTITQIRDVYNLVLPNSEIIWIDNVKAINGVVKFCTRDNFAIEKSYLDGEIINYSYPDFSNKDHISVWIKTKIEPNYQFKIKTNKGLLPKIIFDSNKISVPTIKQIEGSCPNKGKMYQPLNKYDDILSQEQIKIIRKK